MDNYKNFRAEDFLADESFTNYLLQKNEADIKLWEARIASNELNEAELVSAIQLFYTMQDSIKNIHSSVPAQEAAHVIESENTGDVRYIPSARKIQSQLFWRIAIAAAVLICIVGIWKFRSSSAIDKNENALVAEPANSQNTFKIFATATVNGTTVVLPDSSKVILNENSSVSISDEFNKERREVVLVGTAFFDVAKDPGKPFTVTSGDVKTTALGTSFYIHQSSNGKPTTVSLLTGKVRVDAKDQVSINLNPNEKAIYKIGVPLEKEDFDADQLLHWRNGFVHFEKANLSQLSNLIEEYFDKKIITHGKLKDISFTGDFKLDELTSILESLEFTYDLKCRVDGNSVIINF